jgi:alcohol-forming fatty acyl-CoA reductase
MRVLQSPSCLKVKIGAFFDIDGTVLRCQSQRIFARQLWAKKLLKSTDLIGIMSWFFLYKAGFVKESESIRKKVYRLFIGKSEDELKEAFIETNDFLQQEIRACISKRVAEHKQAGHVVIAISATLSNLCEPICAKLAIDECCSTVLSLKNGRYTGEWCGEILEGISKATAVRQLSKSFSIDLSKSFAYADSHLDIPFLETVSTPVAVSPDKKLLKYAKLHNWEIINDRC